MKHRFNLSFKIFSIVFVGFIVVLFFIYKLEVNVHIKNALSINAIENPLSNDTVKAEFQKATGIKDTIFLEYVDSTRTNDDEMYTLLLDPDFNIIVQKQDHLERFNMLSLYGSKTYEVKIDTLSNENREAIIATLQKTTMDDSVEVDGSRTLSNHDTNQLGEERISDEEQTIEIEPTYLKIANTVIFGTPSAEVITDLSFQYYSDDRYMIRDEWLYPNDSYYRSSINKEKDIEQQIPDIIKSKREEVEKISQPNVNYYNYEKINGKYYQWVMVPLIKIDDTKDYYEQEISGYYMKVRYLPMIEKKVSSEYLYDNIKTYAISLGVVLVISIICSYIIVKPIRKIEKVAREIADNNFDSTLDIYYRDELGSLSNSINSMSYNLKETIEKLKEEIAQVKRLEVVRKEFIATFTHEIKTPLAIINGYSELIEETKEHFEIQKYLAIIDEQT